MHPVEQVVREFQPDMLVVAFSQRKPHQLAAAQSYPA